MDVVQEIKNHYDIVDFIGTYVPLKQAGRNYKGLCPFHNEQSPSFMVSPDRQLWRCFGACQKGGDIIAFVMQIENCTFHEAIKLLAEQAGIKIKQSFEVDAATKTKETSLELNTLAAQFFHYVLNTLPVAEHAREYLAKRTISDKITASFQIGYSPDSWNSLTSFLTKKGFKADALVTAGLAINGNRGPYDRFRGRLMFPIYNHRQQIIGFSGRLLEDKPKEAKYINSPETDLYRKRETLFGIQLAKEAIKTSGKAILVEGEFDMISSYMHGIANTVAVKGSAVTKEQLTLLKRFTNHIILSLDQDFSGSETTKRAIKDAEELDFRIDVLQFADAKDPDQILHSNPVLYKTALKNPMPIYDFIIDRAMEKYTDDNPYAAKNVAEEVMEFLKVIQNPIIKNHYLKKLASMIKTDVGALEETLRKVIRKGQPRRVINKPTVTAEDRFVKTQHNVLACILQQEAAENLARIAISTLDDKDFTSTPYKKIFATMQKYFKTDHPQKTPFRDILNELDTPIQATVDELFLTDCPQHTDKTFQRLVFDLKKISLKDQLRQLLKQPAHDADRAQQIQEQLAAVEKSLGVL